MMKKKLFFIAVFTVVTISTIAQNKNRDRIKTLKISFISNAIDLTPNEAEKFWPIYNRHDKRIKQLKTQFERTGTGYNSPELTIDSISDKKAKELIKYVLNHEIEILESKKKLFEELSNVISAKKLLKLQMAEGNFNRKMLQEFGKRRRMNGQ